MKSSIKYIVILLSLFVMDWPAAVAQNKKFETDEFLYGVSVYPELQTKEEQIKMLDLFQHAGINLLRVGESSWGILEPSPGKFNFGWLRYFLDEMHKRGMKAMLGTGSYIAPQWLAAKHPEILWQYEEGNRSHPMARHTASINHPLFREELKKYILALGSEFKDHPSVISWQLDNEIEANIWRRIDYNPSNKKAWITWLKKTYHTTVELNRRLGLKAWGLQTSAIEDVHLPSRSNEGGLPVLYLANLRFQADNVMEYFRWQTALLRTAGVKQWITTDLMMTEYTIADIPKGINPLDISGVNYYQPTGDNAYWWSFQSSYFDMHRSFNGLGRFLSMETRIGPTGGKNISDASGTHQQFVTWMLQPAAFGANGLMHWTGNRFTGGHWPHWGGMLDWSGTPEPDFKWVAEIGSFYKKWGKTLVSTTVDATAAVFTDFDERALLLNYPHVPTEAAYSLWIEACDAFHKNGIGVDLVNASAIRNYENIKKYKTLVIAASPAFDGNVCKPALKQFVENGGTLIITPFTGYQTWDGIFRDKGFAGDLTDLTGVLVRTLRLLGPGSGKDTIKNKVEWGNKWKSGPYTLGMDGMTEILEAETGTEVIARFSTREEVMNNKPAVTVKPAGKGRVFKFAFWPAENNFTKFIHAITTETNPYLEDYLAPGVQAVPRSDNSIFIINPMSYPASVTLKKPMKEQVTGTGREANFQLKPYELVWLK